MTKRTKFTTAEWFSRYSRAIEDMGLASAFATLALEHHHQHPRQRDARRLAYSLAFVVTYARPFTTARDWPDLQKDTLPYLPGAELELHARLLDERDQLWAHTDGRFFKAFAVKSPPFSIDTLNIQHKPHDFTPEELHLAQTMIPKAIRHFRFMRDPYRAELFRTGEALEGWYEEKAEDEHE
jgi:hypothetical protein